MTIGEVATAAGSLIETGAEEEACYPTAIFYGN
jgi:hypothetical protein